MVVTDMGMKQGFKAQTRAQIQGDFIDNCTMYPLSLTPTSHSPRIREDALARNGAKWIVPNH